MAGRDYVKKQIINLISHLALEEPSFNLIAQVMIEEAARMVGVIRVTEGDNRADGLQSLFIACAHEAASETMEIKHHFAIDDKSRFRNDYI